MYISFEFLNITFDVQPSDDKSMCMTKHTSTKYEESFAQNVHDENPFKKKW